MKPTMQLRAMKRPQWISDERTRTIFVIQQLWKASDEEETYTEWRDIPVVDEALGESEWRI